MTNLDDYPKYYLVDTDIYVKVYLEDDYVLAMNHKGVFYPPMKAMGEGQEISEEEFEKHTAKKKS